MCCLCSGQFAAQPLWQGFYADPCRPFTTVRNLKVATEVQMRGLALLDLPWGVFPLYACLWRFNLNRNPSKNGAELNVPNPKRDLLWSLCTSWSPPGVVEAIQWNSISYLCPFTSQYGVREPLPGLSWHTLFLSPSSPHMPWTSQDILKLDICLVFICS